MNGTNNRVPTRQEGSGEHRITARTVRTADGTVATEYRVDGRVAGSVPELKALLHGGSA